VADYRRIGHKAAELLNTWPKAGARPLFRVMPVSCWTWIGIGRPGLTKLEPAIHDLRSDCIVVPGDTKAHDTTSMMASRLGSRPVVSRSRARMSDASLLFLEEWLFLSPEDEIIPQMVGNGKRLAPVVGS